MAFLSDLAKHFGTDKFPWYTPFYDLLFGDTQRRMCVSSVLEIGILNGASLRMWRDYFSHADIYGMDIDPKRLFTEGRITTFQGDQGSVGDLCNVVEKIRTSLDLVIDDGSHDVNHQILGVTFFWPYLSEGGLYIIEDVNEPVSNVSDRLPFTHQVIHCHVPGSKLVGRCIVIPKGE